jgi:hypothetical protein
MAALIADLLLLAGLTLRIIHLVTTDTISDRYLRQPAYKWAGDDERREFWAEGLECPWCVGFWLSGVCLASLILAGGPGDAADWWRVAAGWFTLSYLAARAESLMN